MLSERELSAAIGSPAHDAEGDKVGTVEHFFVDDRTGAPTWVAVMTGVLGTRHSIAPAADAALVDGALRLPVSREAVRGAPDVSGTHLDPADEAALRRHYGLDVARSGPPPWRPTGEGVVPAGAAPEHDVAPSAPMPLAAPPPVPGAAAPSTDGAMTRSEERLRVGTQPVAASRVRLVKYVVTEEVQITVPVRREEIRVEQVPLDAPEPGPGESLVAPGEPAGPGAQRGGLPDEIILHTERPVVTVEVVPTERVRLRTELVEGQETVTGQVQREQIVVDQEPFA
jgi:hypothetical protein